MMPISNNTMKKLLLLTAMILIPTQAKSETACFADAYGVRRHSPDAWVSWTFQMKGHIGEKCYYPTTKDKRYDHSRIAQFGSEHQTLTLGVGSSNLPAAALIPLPRPSPLYEANTELVFLTPSQLREPRQRWDELPEWQPKPNPEIEKAEFDLFVKQIFLGVVN